MNRKEETAAGQELGINSHSRGLQGFGKEKQ